MPVNAPTIYSPNFVRHVLQSYDLSPKKSYGQNFLWDKNILLKICEQIPISHKNIYLEIGPGLGHLSGLLIERLHQLIMVEKDRGLFHYLQSELISRMQSYNIHLLHEDFLKLNLMEWVSYPRKLFIIGNVPYNITTPILEKIIEEIKGLEGAVLLLQREFVQRLIAKPGNKNYGSITIFAGIYLEIKEKFIVPKQVFYPIPQIDSQLIVITPKKVSEEQTWLQDKKWVSSIVRSIFFSRRKKLSSSLKQSPFYSFEPELIRRLFRHFNWNDNIRGEEVSIDQALKLLSLVQLYEIRSDKD